MFRRSLSTFSRWLAVATLVFALSGEFASAQEDDWSKEVAAMEQIAFPRDSRWQHRRLVKWAGPIQVAIVADTERDASLARSAYEAFVSALPAEARSLVQLQTEIDLSNSKSFAQKVVIYISEAPYDDLRGRLRPLFESLQSQKMDVDQLISAMKEENRSDYNTFLLRQSGEIAGYLEIMQSGLAEEDKYFGVYASLIYAVSPTLNFVPAFPYLVERPGKPMALTKLGQDYLRLMLSTETKPGMSREAFTAVARRLP